MNSYIRRGLTLIVLEEKLLCYLINFFHTRVIVISTVTDLNYLQVIVLKTIWGYILPIILLAE